MENESLAKKEKRSSSSRNLLFSFFLRDNPCSDPWIDQGYGPMRRKTNLGDPIPVPDTVLTSQALPFSDCIFNLEELLDCSKEGKNWLNSFHNYLDYWGSEVSGKLLFGMKALDFPEKLRYVHFEGKYRSTSIFNSDDHMFEIHSLPEGMIYGDFGPKFEVHKKGNPEIHPIILLCNGGKLSERDNHKDGYTAQKNIGGVYLSSPHGNTLLGDLRRGRYAPYTHFVEYTLKRFASGKNPIPSPGIRIEIHPDEGISNSFEREIKWREDKVKKRKGRTLYSK